MTPPASRGLSPCPLSPLLPECRSLSAGRLSDVLLRAAFGSDRGSAESLTFDPAGWSADFSSCLLLLLHPSAFSSIAFFLFLYLPQPPPASFSLPPLDPPPLPTQPLFLPPSVLTSPCPLLSSSALQWLRGGLHCGLPPWRRDSTPLWPSEEALRYCSGPGSTTCWLLSANVAH